MVKYELVHNPGAELQIEQQRQQYARQQLQQMAAQIEAVNADRSRRRPGKTDGSHGISGK